MQGRVRAAKSSIDALIDEKKRAPTVMAGARYRTSASVSVPSDVAPLALVSDAEESDHTGAQEEEGARLGDGDRDPEE